MILDIKTAIVKALKAAFPACKVYVDRVQKLEAPAFSVEFIDVSTKQLGGGHVEWRVTADIIYFPKNETANEALSMMSQLDGVLTPYLVLGERTITSTDAESVIVDELLHHTIRLNIAGYNAKSDSCSSEGEIMQELNISN